MTSAEAIIGKFGGTRAMAAALGVPPSTVQSWKSAGLIPARQQGRVLEVGRTLERPVTPNDFFDQPAADQATSFEGDDPPVTAEPARGAA